MKRCKDCGADVPKRDWYGHKRDHIAANRDASDYWRIVRSRAAWRYGVAGAAK